MSKPKESMKDLRNKVEPKPPRLTIAQRLKESKAKVHPHNCQCGHCLHIAKMI